MWQTGQINKYGERYKFSLLLDLPHSDFIQNREQKLIKASNLASI